MQTLGKILVVAKKKLVAKKKTNAHTHSDCWPSSASVRKGKKAAMDE
jgi:hypothetical protein